MEGYIRGTLAGQFYTSRNHMPSQLTARLHAPLSEQCKHETQSNVLIASSFTLSMNLQYESSPST